MIGTSRQIQSHRAKAAAFGLSAVDCRDMIEAMRLSGLAQIHGSIADELLAGEQELEAVFRGGGR